MPLDREAHAWWTRSGTWWLGAGFALVLVRFACFNHLSADRSRRRLTGQLGCLFAYAMVAWLVLSLVGAMKLASRTAVSGL